MCHGTSQEVQWLGLNTSNAEGTGLIAAQGTKIVHAGPKVQKTWGLRVADEGLQVCNKSNGRSTVFIQ